ncbi:MAG: hypothetical protein COB46_05495 [Rhodospirillaceae bacterium]|nr:MAG: hypothetical protein COB46_05495 [Rhodospirillaceae bacterium]
MSEHNLKNLNSKQDVLACFLRCAEKWPNHDAILTRQETISYQDFAQKVRRLAHEIVSLGKAPRVLIALDQGVDAYAAIFATLYAGGYYAPLNTTAPQSRHRLVLDSFQPDIVIVSKTTSALIDDGGHKTIVVEDINTTELNEPQDAHELAYVIFTSGSTGVPKGVEIRRMSLAHYINWAVKYLKLGPEERVSQHPNIGFDLSVLDIYGALCSGACLVPIIGAKDRMFPAEVIRDLNITTWISVPSMIDFMHRAGQLTTKHLSGLRQLFFCGEPLLKAHLEKLFGALPKVSVINAYGPTEATVSCTAQSLSATNYQEFCKEGSVSFGEVIPGMTIELHQDGISGNEGEIILAGPQVAKGYWKDPERTQDRFDESGPSFSTGDWARKENGKYYFVQRTDRQVKIQGNRLELGEIDVALRQCGATASATVYVEQKLISYVEGDASLDVDKLRLNLREFLSSYAIPCKIIWLDMLPRNSSDKIDHGALSKRAKEKDVEV